MIGETQPHPKAVFDCYIYLFSYINNVRDRFPPIVVFDAGAAFGDV